MGAFALACLCGFLGYRARSALLGWLRQNWLTNDNASFVSLIVGFGVVLGGLVLWAFLSEDSFTFDHLVDGLSDGRVARFLFGLALGAAGGYVLALRSSGQVSNNAAAITPTEKLTFGGLRPHFILSVALGTTILAIAAPHVDAWLSNLTSFKSPLVELQVASTSTHKISVVEGSATLFNIDSIDYLKAYNDRLAHDIDYISNYGQDLSKQKDILASANQILPAFREVLQPVATCLKRAMDEDWLSIEQARGLVRPAAEAAEKIVFGEGTESLERDQELWNGLADIPKKVGAKYCETPIFTKFPVFKDHKKVPYLYVAAALLVSFLADDDKALRILQKARETDFDTKKSSLDIQDYYFLYMIARLFYYTGKPGDVAGTYFGPLNEMYSTARSHIDALQRASQTCKSEKDLLCREQKAQALALDAMTYYVAEDLARGSKAVSSYVTRLKGYSEELKEIIDEADKNVSKSNDYYSYVRAEKYRYLDTYAYATLILEARKSNPDHDLIKRKVVWLLEDVVEEFSAKTARSVKIDRADLAQLRIFEAHLASAKSLVGD
jgi:hypothetical protein